MWPVGKRGDEQDMSAMPRQKPGLSKQDYQTPKELLDAVRKRLKIIDFAWDLAADSSNSVTTKFYDEEADSLTQPWNLGGWNWCNPPYAKIEPWVAKAAHEAQLGAQTVMIVPASVGANWWREWVEPYAFVSFLNGRLCFIPDWKEVGFKTKPLYPKDCAILLYTPWNFVGHEIWNWGAD